MDWSFASGSSSPKGFIIVTDGIPRRETSVVVTST